MDIGILLSVIQTLSTILQYKQLKEAWSIWGYKSDLDELSGIVATVKKVFLDSEAKYDELSQETLLYIRELKDALYDADDLVDEFITLAKQRELMGDRMFIKKARLFFSRYNQLGVAYNMSQKVKKIMKKLDGIASKHSKFGLNLDHIPTRSYSRYETCSFPDTEIIGRGEDLDKIVEMILEPNVQRDVSFLTIVGMGGLGKTALAQLVYNHENITREFPLKLWTCVSDHDQSKLDVKTILTKILEAATHEKHDGYSMEVVVDLLRKVLVGKRFFIVLDDLWTESRDEWRKLAGHLVGGERGNHVMVTTRSKETAKIVGNGLMYELKGLSDDNSWRLFQLMAFEQGVEQAGSNHRDDFINIGQDIVKTCANIPLAIRVIGGLLFGQAKSKWLSVQELGLTNLREVQNGIIPILKLSYHNLEPPLKSCFSYCSIYPRDFRILKESAISLWIAQGFVVPLEKGQSIKDASEVYFSILLRRCFFQDIWKDEVGGIISFKMHDLMHDVASQVAEQEICSASSFTGHVDKAVRHLSLTRKQYANHSFPKAGIRTYHQVGTCYSDIKCAKLPIVKVVANFKCLRTLDLSYLDIKILPNSIGKLIHLRYLNLSHSYNMEVLPKSITKLYNLQTLNLNQCGRLKELPRDLSKLVNLIVLNLSSCGSLASMPLGMGKLTDLSTLSNFVVRVENSSLKQHVELEGLKALKKLRGYMEIDIYFPENGAFVKDDTVRGGCYIRDKELLNNIRFGFKHEESNEGATGYEEELLGALQPHANLKQLDLVGYRGARIPRWADKDNLATSIPNLVRLSLSNCSELQYLPSIGKLQHLKRFKLYSLPNLEYVEPWSSREAVRFFPCLEELLLLNLPKLEEWYRRSGMTVGGDNSISSIKVPQQSSAVFLSQLKVLLISNCPDLTSLLHCPKLEKLRLYRFCERLRIISNPTSSNLRDVKIDNIAWLPVESFRSLNSLALKDNKEIETLTDIELVLQACTSSLLTLTLLGCPQLRRLSRGLSYLTALNRLVMYFLPNVNLTDEDIDGDVNGDGMPWGSLSHTLHHLEIYHCKQVETFPKWMRKLISLRHLSVRCCSERLYERCRNPNGEDWSNIQHIPHIEILLD